MLTGVPLAQVISASTAVAEECRALKLIYLSNKYNYLYLLITLITVDTIVEHI